MFRLVLTSFLLLSLSGALNADDSKIYIGLDADLSSVAKAGGLAIQRGAQVAIDEINKEGGILGKQIELISKDHKGNPARGISNLKKFAKKENLIAVFGGVHTPVVLQELQVIHDSELLFLVPWAAGTPITSNKFTPNYVFRVSVRDAEAGPVLVKSVAERGLKSVSLFLERTGWGRSNEKSMTAAASELGIEIKGVHWINWGEKDVSSQLSAIEKEQPDAIMLVANAPEGVVVTQGLSQSEALASKPLISHWGIAGGNYVDGLGLERLAKMDVSTIQTFSFINAHDKTLAETVMAKYRTKYDENATDRNIPGVVGFAQAYDLVHLLRLAADNAGTTDRSAIRTALENIQSHDGLIKKYDKPFSADQHDALLRDDYFISIFDEDGNLIPR